MARQGRVSNYYFSSYNYYAKGRKDDIITPERRIAWGSIKNKSYKRGLTKPCWIRN